MRLIDADKAVQELQDFYHDSYSEVQIAPYQVDRWIEQQPTVDAVTLADIIEVEKERNYWHDLSDSYERTILKLNRALRESAPVRHGKWIDETFEPWGLVHHPFKCNICGEHAEYSSLYCPNCGAKMDEEKESNHE